MNDGTMRKRNKICLVLSIVVAIALIFMVYVNHRQEEARTATVLELQEEAKAYESELQELQAELGDLGNTVAYTSEEAGIMIGFCVSDSSDLSYIEEKAETYDFSPVLVIDCTMDMADIESLISEADEDWEIMLYASGFSEEANDEVLSVLSYLESEDREHTGIFLLRDDYSSESNIQLLTDDGFIGYTSYHSESPAAGQAEDGSVYFDYSFLTTTGTAIGSRISALYSSKATLIVVLDVDSIHSESLPEEYVTEFFEFLQYYTAEDDCSFITVADAVQELSEVNAIEAANQAEYEEQAAGIQERIDELEEIIDEIYDKLGQ